MLTLLYACCFQACDGNPWHILMMLSWPSAITLALLSLALEMRHMHAEGAGVRQWRRKCVRDETCEVHGCRCMRPFRRGMRHMEGAGVGGTNV